MHESRSTELRSAPTDARSEVLRRLLRRLAPSLAWLTLATTGVEARPQAGPWEGSTITSSVDFVTSLASADFDRDGDTDLLAAVGGENALAWFENAAGDGSSWVEAPVAADLGGVDAVVAADLDGDGDIDAVAAVTLDGEVTWHENAAGDGSAWAEHAIADQADLVRSVFVADLDGDGAPDVLSAAQGDDTVRWHRNSLGNATPWATFEITTAADGAQDVFAADVDGDGDLDAVSASFFDDSLDWYENAAGDASVWTTHEISSTADGAVAVRMADLDGDGDLDALGASSNADSLSWYENTAGDGSVWNAQLLTSQAFGVSSLAATDLDRDGDLDVLVAAIDADSVSWFENTDGEASNWIERVVSSTSDGADSALALDLDRDGDLDVVAGSRFGDTIEWFSNLAATIPGEPCGLRSISDAAPGVRAAVAGDVDRDGDLDMLAAGGSLVTWYENTLGDGTLWKPTSIATGAADVRSVVAVDVDRDGDVDAVAAEAGSGTVAWHDNESGDGSVWTRRAIGDASGAAAVAQTDVNGDGSPDVLAAAPATDSIHWFDNQAGDGSSWTRTTISSGAAGVTALAAADVDGDGDVDVLAAWTAGDALAWHDNESGDGSTWSSTQVSATVAEPRTVFAADVDRDGDVDVLSASFVDRTIAWHENSAGDGSVWTEHAVTAESEPLLALDPVVAVLAADMDDDGDPDVVAAAEEGDTVAWYVNTDGAGTSWEAHTISHGATAGAASVTVADVDGDGDRDLVVAAAGADRAVWFENRSFAASEVVRLGTPPNPDALRPGQTSGPVLGQVWDPLIDHTEFLPESALDVLSIGLTSTEVETPVGTLLCAPTLFVLLGDPGDPFELPLPLDCTLLGATVCAQGLSWDGEMVALTNALDATFGNL